MQAKHWAYWSWSLPSVLLEQTDHLLIIIDAAPEASEDLGDELVGIPGRSDADSRAIDSSPGLRLSVNQTRSRSGNESARECRMAQFVPHDVVGWAVE